MRAVTTWAVGLAVVLVCAGAHAQKPGPAQSYPAKPIRFICPYNPGGAGDLFTRTIAPKLTEYLGQSVVVDNRAGANGGIGTALVAKATPDGYTILMGSSGPLTVNPNLYRKVPYDPVRDFQPVSQGTVYWYVLVVLNTAPFKSLDELIAMLKLKQGALTYGSTGIGGGKHLAGELFNLMSGTKAIHVPYTGSAAALRSLLRGQTNYMFETVVTAVPLVRAGQLRAFAVTAMKRSQALPEIPTLDQLGLKGYDITQWQAVVAPAGTPRAIVEKLHRAVVRALKSPDVIERIGPRAGNELVGNTPEEFARVIKNDLAKYSKIIKAAGITVQ
ncbi:MAG: tripartite tricarboxylate transporter substrate binding protein [Betaproteobacteria bacterium]|nr:tripartite tricarboxylate transporter substrate binding protein [Betaproteobacteria bacterium]MDH3435988.1 tripartite tricarboxylate transporter substrate binding protein [Betaproteobacteria bacterium]